MSEIKSRIAYIRGLMDGSNFNTEDANGKIVSSIVDALDMIADELDELFDSNDEIVDVIDEISDGLEELEDFVYDDDDDEHHHHCHCHDEDDEDEDEEEENDYMEFDCPNCGHHLIYDIPSFDVEEEHFCPNCQAPLMFEEEYDEDDPEEEDE